MAPVPELASGGTESHSFPLSLYCGTGACYMELATASAFIKEKAKYPPDSRRILPNADVYLVSPLSAHAK